MASAVDLCLWFLDPPSPPLPSPPPVPAHADVDDDGPPPSPPASPPPVTVTAATAAGNGDGGNDCDAKGAVLEAVVACDLGASGCVRLVAACTPAFVYACSMVAAVGGGHRCECGARVAGGGAKRAAGRVFCRHGGVSVAPPDAAVAAAAAAAVAATATTAAASGPLPSLPSPLERRSKTGPPPRAWCCTLRHWRRGSSRQGWLRRPTRAASAPSACRRRRPRPPHLWPWG